MLPLKNVSGIQKRLNMVQAFKQEDELRAYCSEELKKVGDLERLVAKLSVKRAQPRDLLQISKALKSIRNIKEKLSNIGHLDSIGRKLNSCDQLIDKIDSHIMQDSSWNVGQGKVIEKGLYKEIG